MVYEIDGKYYIMANHKFYEVKVEKKGMNNYNVVLVKNGKQLEFKTNTVYTQVAVDKAYKSTQKNIDD